MQVSAERCGNLLHVWHKSVTGLFWKGSEMPKAIDASDGWIYLVGSGLSPKVAKIGFASDPHRRLSSLQTGSAEKLGIMLAIPGTRIGERVLHKSFAEYRVKGEWFANADIIYHAMDMAFENILDLAQERLAHWDEDDPITLDDLAETIPYHPLMLAKEAKRAIAYFAYGRATDDWNMDLPGVPAELLAESP
jgi:hypothetical protein